MKTILEISYNYPCEVFIYRHIESLYQQDYPIQVLARHASRKYAESVSVQEPIDTKIRYRIIPKIDLLSPGEIKGILKHLIDIKNFSNFKTLIRDRVSLEFIRRLNPDLIHFHFGNLAGSWCWIPQELGIPYTLSLRGSDIQVVPLISDENLRQFQAGLNHAAGIHTVCENLWVLAKSYLEHDVFHNTIYTTVPIIERLPIRNVDAGEFRFVTIGRLHWRKNYVYLLKAFRHLLDAGLNAELLIIGEGSEQESLLYWISILGLQKKISFSEKLNFNSMREIMANSTGYIQSSIAEGFSNATAEAMALGVPVFATDVGGTGEIIRDGVNGFLLDPLMPENWFKKLILVKDIQLMEMIRINAWQTAKEKFSESVHANAFIGFYEHVLNNHV